MGAVGFDSREELGSGNGVKMEKQSVVETYHPAVLDK